MALTSTTYKVFLDISDTDRGVYEAVHMTVARHPSETEERLVARILAYGLWYLPSPTSLRCVGAGWMAEPATGSMSAGRIPIA